MIGSLHPNNNRIHTEEWQIENPKGRRMVYFPLGPNVCLNNQRLGHAIPHPSITDYILLQLLCALTYSISVCN